MAKLESVQSMFGRAVLGLKDYPAAAGVRAELGLPSLLCRRRMLQLNYWHKLCTSPSDRLLVQVFRARHAAVSRGEAKHSLFHNFRTTLSAVGLGSYWTSRSAGADEDSWRLLVSEQCAAVEGDEWEKEVLSHGSLRLYRGLRQRPELGVACYLDDRTNILGTRLMSRLRLGTLWVMTRIASVAKFYVSDLCPLCLRDPESAMHFLCSCPVLDHERRAYREIMMARLRLAGVVGMAYVDFLQLVWTEPSLAQLELLLMSGFPLPSPPDDMSREWMTHHSMALEADPEQRIGELVAQCRFMVCATTKNYLARCWHVRSDKVGSYRLEAGCLVHEPADPCPKVRQPASLEVKTQILCDSRRWSPWLERRVPLRSARKARPNANFFVVWKGHNRGVMYRYWDVLNSIKGYAGAKFKGFQSLAAAEAAFVRGPPGA